MLRVYRTYYSFLWRYKWRCLLFAAVLIIYSISRNIQPYFYKLFLDAIPRANYRHLLSLLYLFVGIRLVRLITDNLTAILGDWLTISAARDARLAVFKKIQDLDFAYHLSKSTGSLISAIKRGDNAFFDIHHNLNIQTTRVLIGFFLMIFLLRTVNPYIALIMVLTMVVNLFLAYFLIKHSINARRQYNHVEDDISDIIVDNLINFETVKLFAKEQVEHHRLASTFLVWVRKLWDYANSFRLIDVTIGVTGNFGLFLALFLGLRQLVAFELTAGDYIMVFAFVSDFYPQFFELIYQFRSVAKNHADIQKYFSVLGEEVQVKDPITPVTKENISGDIEFKNVSFVYPECKKGALNHINLHIRPGQSIAFVGHSGVGKTTLVKLLMRFYDPTSGHILLDGVDIRDFTKHQLRSFMGVVPQEPILFNHTIAYNIGYGANNPSQQQIVAAAKLANLHDFIVSLPKKYDTHVGERGVKLSGGQKQRLAIARMILSNPDIIIFDEATSQLDSESEKLIQDAFWKAVKNKTTLIIAHRLSTITRAEKIVVMEKGKVKEIGSHRELLSKSDSLYSHFWQLQAGS